MINPSHLELQHSHTTWANDVLGNSAFFLNHRSVDTFSQSTKSIFWIRSCMTSLSSSYVCSDDKLLKLRLKRHFGMEPYVVTCMYSKISIIQTSSEPANLFDLSTHLNYKDIFNTQWIQMVLCAMVSITHIFEIIILIWIIETLLYIDVRTMSV